MLIKVKVNWVNFINSLNLFYKNFFFLKFNFYYFLFKIKLQTLTGKEIEIDIEPTDKVDRIKERVEEKEGIPPQQQRLIFSGKQMWVFNAIINRLICLIMCIIDYF